MIIASFPENEVQRIHALLRYDILDTPPEPAFDKLVELAAHICRTPIAVISLVDENRQWFKAVTGLNACETSRDVAFCAHAILSDEIMVVPDATLDSRFADNPLVTGVPAIRFYAGVPLITPDQFPLGTLCVIDYVPRYLIESELKALKIIAEQAVAQLELRLSLKKNKQYASDLMHTKEVMALEHERLEAKKRYKQMFDDAASIAFLLDPENSCIVDANKAASTFWGYTREELRGMPISNINTSTQEEILVSIFQLRNNQTNHLEWIQKLKNGELHHVDVYSGPLVIQGKTLLYSVLHDITERKRTEDELREKEERLALATLHNGVGIWDWNLVTQQMIWDESMYALYHIRREDFIGTEEAWRASLHPDDLERGDREVDAAIRGEKPFDTEFRVVWPNGEIRYIKAVAKVFRDKKGAPLRMLGTNVDITERKQAELQLQQSEAHFRFATESAQALIWMSGKDKLCTWFNKVWLDFTGRTIEQEMGDGWVEGVHPDDVGHCYEIYVSHFDIRKPFSLEYRLRRHDGEYRWIVDNGTPRFNTQGTFEGYIGSCFDITDRKRNEENLRITASVFDNSQDGIVITDFDNNVLQINPAFTRITGYSREEMIGKNPKLLNSGRQDKAFYTEMWQTLQQKRAWRGEVWNRRKSGEIYAELLSIGAICDDAGNVQRYVGVFSDISPLKEHEAELSQVANYDALTGIPNRRLLADRLGQAIVRAQRSGKMLSVCYIDLDGFKQVNDQFGHESGDLLLVEITCRLHEALRAGDTLARLGGDEFVVLFNDLANAQECLQILDRILEIVALPVTIGKNEAAVTASIGVSFYPSDHEDGDTLLRHADQAMYVAKQTGKSRYHLYDSEHDQRVRTLHESRRRILHGLNNGEFELFYQPKIELVSGAVVGVEALIRWHHPERGMLLPAEFLPFIDDSDIDIKLGEWVIDTALAQINVWHREGLQLEVSINISAHHLQSPGFVVGLEHRLALYPELPHDKLQIEVLESAALKDIPQSAEIIETCRKMGVNFALDDFGTGYSSLAYLSKLSAGTLKIDQSFVRGMLTSEGDRAIVQGIIALAKTFGRKTVAEGMEATELVNILIDIGCMYGQGFGIARPMPSEDFMKWNKARH